MKLTIKFSISKLEVDVPARTTVGDLITNSNYQGALGFDNSVEAVVRGSVVPRDRELSANDEVVLRKVANTKA